MTEPTKDLIQAVVDDNPHKALAAIKAGAQINCRVVPSDSGGFEIAGTEQLGRSLAEERVPNAAMIDPYFKDPVMYQHPVMYTVPMVGTTTLLNYLARKKPLPATLELAKILMEHGADLGGIDYLSYWEGWGNHPANYFQNTPLLNAIAEMNISFALLYMSYLARLPIDARQEILNYKDKFIAGFHTALEFAIRRGYSALATMIVKAGADPNPQPFVYCLGGGSPLHMACMLFGNSYSRATGSWDEHLGSDLELVITLIKHNADCSKLAETRVCVSEGFDEGSRAICYLTPFDYLPLRMEEGNDFFDFTGACDGTATNLVMRGQVQHPFQDVAETAPFLHGLAENHRVRESARRNYLTSATFLRTDKHILQVCLLKVVIEDYNRRFTPQIVLEPDDHAYTILNKLEANDMHRPWVTARLKLIGILPRTFEELQKKEEEGSVLSKDENPLFNPAKQNKITCGDKGCYHAPEPYQSMPESPGPRHQAILAPETQYPYGKSTSRWHLLPAKAPKQKIAILFEGKVFEIIPGNSGLHGDLLKRTILLNTATHIGQIKTRSELEQFKSHFIQSDAKKILEKPQGITSTVFSFFGKTTDSAKALETLFNVPPPLL